MDNSTQPSAQNEPAVVKHRSPKRCENCRFWVRGEDQPRGAQVFNEGGGECRKRSPSGASFFLYQTQSAKKVAIQLFPFPPTHAEDWCGEHEAAVFA